MIQFIAFLIFTGLVGLFSWRATRRDNHSTSTGYFLAGRSLPWIVVGGSLLLTNLSTEQLVGLNGGAFKNGMQVMAWEVWSSIAIVLMALVFLPRYLKGGVATVSLFLERRYSKVVGTAVSVLLLLSLLTNLLPFVLYSGALFMIKVFNIEQILNVSQAEALWITVIALGVVGSLYAIFGGLKAVAISDTFNGIGLLIGGLLIPVLGLIVLGNELGGGGGFGAGISYLMENHPERLSPIGKEGENIPFSTLFTGMLLITTYYWCTNQAIVQRTFASKSLAEGQKGVLFAAGMKLLGPLYLVLPGIIAWHMFGDTIKPDDSYGALV
ncbi:MAG: solute:sodium symporter family transporter, partial [Verrucomicrobiota bacterium]|nr:solute:sodium symporter family transporter [Verrucomicrobiota bacterium]